MPLVLVYKAKRKQKKLTRSQLIAESFEPKVRTAFRTSMDSLLTDAQIARLARAVRDHDMVAAMQVIPPTTDPDSSWASMRDAFAENYKSIIEAAGMDEIASMEIGTSFDLKIDSKYIDKWVNDKSRQMASDIDDGTRAGIKNAIRTGMGDGLSIEQTANIIRPMIGLSERDAAAVQNRLEMHLDDGIDEDRAADLAEQYGETLLDARAERIARTESTTAASEGKQESWRQARENGLTGDNPTKTWVGSAFESSKYGACEVCADLDGTSIPLDDMFDTPWGKISGPAAHPNCRCTLSFDPGFGD